VIDGIAAMAACLQIGDVVQGVVQSVKPYGAFIDLGGVTGLLHVSQISHERITNVDKIMKEGDKLKVGGAAELTCISGDSNCQLVHANTAGPCVPAQQQPCQEQVAPSIGAGMYLSFSMQLLCGSTAGHDSQPGP
jgi:hypothetical protein